jgi:hypothetical protein
MAETILTRWSRSLAIAALIWVTTSVYPNSGLAAEPQAAAASGALAKGEEAPHPTLAIGATLPQFALKGVDAKVHTPADYKKSPILVVMFISNHCPASQLYEGREKR